MKKFLFFLISISSTVFAFAEEVADYKLEIHDFDQLKVTDAINVEYFCSEDSAGWAYFTCAPSVAEHLLFTNNKSQLHIQVDLIDITADSLPTLKIYSSSLSKVENTAECKIVINNPQPVQNFKARIVGNGMIVVNDLEAGSVDAGINTGKGHMVINGTASRVKLSNVGKGPMEAGALKGSNVKVVLLGTGNIDCCATESLSVYGAGSGKVYYVGNPQKIVNRSLGVKAIEVGTEE